MANTVCMNYSSILLCSFTDTASLLSFIHLYVFTPEPCICRYDAGIPQGENNNVIIWVASGDLETKSNIRCGWGILEAGSGLNAWIISGNFIASRMKKIFKLLPTKSQFPSSVYILTANPRGSRAVSGESFAPATVEKRTKTGVCFPTPEKTLALVYVSTGSSPTFP